MAPDGPIYAIGDIHGRLDLFESLLQTIREDAKAQRIERPHIVTIGDYIDRGPKSCGVIDLLMELASEESVEITSLMGNHEEWLLGFLKDPEEFLRWLEFGGVETCESFGVMDVGLWLEGEMLATAASSLNRRIGPERLAFLNDLKISHQSGNVFFCHAGTDPSLPLEKQLRRTLLWNRNYKGFRRDGIWTVHGHTVTSKPIQENGRINIDTGAFSTDRLTAVALAQNSVRFLQNMAD